MNRVAVAAVARLELFEVLRSRWLWLTLGVYAVLASVFVLVGLRESTVMEFTGSGRVLLSFSHALILLLPLLALLVTGQVVNQARANGALELLLGLPVGRWDYFVAVSLVRLGVLVLPLVVTVLGVALFGLLAFGQAVPWGFVARALVSSTALVVAFVGIGFLLTTSIKSPARSVMAVLLTWLLAAALLDFALVGLMLEARLPPRLVFVLAALNPVEGARLALLSGLDPELSSLGPVGFYLANRLGAAALFGVGVGWATFLGVVCWAGAGWVFGRSDVV